MKVGTTLFVSFLFLTSFFPQAQAGRTASECVVLLHGLARTGKSMSKLEKRLIDNGYCVLNVGYPSRTETIEKLSADTIPQAVESCREKGAKKVHFATHSMGGVLIRYYLEHHPMPELGRVVMLSPPNGGSEVVDKLGDTALFKWIFGPAGQQLGTGKDSLPKSLGKADFCVGIITGDRTIYPIASLMIPGPDDGRVSVESAKLEGMNDFLVVHRSHPFIMTAKEVIQQTVEFLKTGRFKRDRQKLPVKTGKN